MTHLELIEQSFDYIWGSLMKNCIDFALFFNSYKIVIHSLFTFITKYINLILNKMEKSEKLLNFLAYWTLFIELPTINILAFCNLYVN